MSQFVPGLFPVITWPPLTGRTLDETPTIQHSYAFSRLAKNPLTYNIYHYASIS